MGERVKRIRHVAIDRSCLVGTSPIADGLAPRRQTESGRQQAAN